MRTGTPPQAKEGSGLRRWGARPMGAARGIGQRPIKCPDRHSGRMAGKQGYRQRRLRWRYVPGRQAEGAVHAERDAGGICLAGSDAMSRADAT